MNWTLGSLFYTLLFTLFVSGFSAAMAHDKTYSCLLESSHDSRLQTSDVNDGPDIFPAVVDIITDEYYIALAAAIYIQTLSALTVCLPECRAPPVFS
ncbi:MAG: hypothetical protein OEX03_04520 [Gammaproteobacteria bacterium]|nr:hypothetical protein [Gammaproteobacteria bacterium]